MGRYMRKSKTTREVAVMDVSQSSLGVRTRAKTLALRKSAVSSPPPAVSDVPYIQLRSRRLVMRCRSCAQSPNSRSSRARGSNENSKSASLIALDSERVRADEEVIEDKEKKEGLELGLEGSIGDNALELEGRESTRETTPCSLIRDPDVIGTPGSSTRPTSSAQVNRRTALQRHIPTAGEMDEFFAETEKKQQRQFIEKYNFDPVNEKPLPGRYEWVQMDPKKCSNS